MMPAFGLFTAQKEQALREWPAAKRAVVQLRTQAETQMQRALALQQAGDAAGTEIYRAALEQRQKLIVAQTVTAPAFDAEIRAAGERAIAAGKLTREDFAGSGLGMELVTLVAILVAFVLIGAWATYIGFAQTRATASATLAQNDQYLKEREQALTAGRTPPAAPPLVVPPASTPYAEAAKSIGSFGVIAGLVVLVAMFWKGGSR